MTAPGAPPQGVGQDDRSSGPGNPDHLIGHPPGFVDVLGDIRRVGDIEARGGEGK